jgi:hypothetical protein
VILSRVSKHKISVKTLKKKKKISWIDVFYGHSLVEASNGVLQFSKHYHHIKFQAIISKHWRVLEAIPSERRRVRFGGKWKIYGGSKIVSH